MSQDTPKIDPEGAFNRLFEMEQKSAFVDSPVIEQADDVIRELRLLRVENNWAQKVALRFRGA